MNAVCGCVCVCARTCSWQYGGQRVKSSTAAAAAAVPQMGVTTPAPYYANTNRLLIAML